MELRGNVILRYVRNNQCWICPECDEECAMTENRCTLCGHVRTVSDRIKRPGQFEENPVPSRPLSPPATPGGYGTGTPYTPVPPSSSGSSNAAAWIVLGIIGAIFLFILLAAASGGFAYNAPLPEHLYVLNSDSEFLGQSFNNYGGALWKTGLNICNLRF